MLIVLRPDYLDRNLEKRDSIWRTASDDRCLPPLCERMGFQKRHLIIWLGFHPNQTYYLVNCKTSLLYPPHADRKASLFPNHPATFHRHHRLQAIAQLHHKKNQDN